MNQIEQLIEQSRWRTTRGRIYRGGVHVGVTGSKERAERIIREHHADLDRIVAAALNCGLEKHVEFMVQGGPVVMKAEYDALRTELDRTKAALAECGERDVWKAVTLFCTVDQINKISNFVLEKRGEPTPQAEHGEDDALEYMLGELALAAYQNADPNGSRIRKSGKAVLAAARPMIRAERDAELRLAGIQRYGPFVWDSILLALDPAPQETPAERVESILEKYCDSDLRCGTGRGAAAIEIVAELSKETR